MSLAASIQASTAVGLSYGDVVASFAPEMPLTHIGHGQMSAERPIDLSQLRQTAQSWIRTPLLIQTSHTHLFGQTLIAGLLGLLFLFSSLGEGKKAVIVALPFIGLCWILAACGSPALSGPPVRSWCSLGGSVFALGYLLIAGIALYELWFQREVHP